MNRERKILLNVVILAVALGIVGVANSADMGTAFTYQGKFYDANSLAEGVYDFEFELYDDAAAGSQQASTVSKDDVDVTDGYFTVLLDFGDDPNIFGGDARWLQIAVRHGASMEVFTTLSPRQEITPAPYALYARGDDVGITIETDPTVLASVKDGVSWSEVSNRPAGLDDGDDIGITSETDPEVGIIDSNSVPRWNGSALVTGTIYDNGNVGIGTTDPGTKLDVQGGDINTSGKIKEGGNNLIPSGAVMFFNLPSCPSGWSELTAARGRYLVGKPSGGTLAGTQGTALTDLENRPVGQHDHSITDPGHGHELASHNNMNCGSGCSHLWIYADGMWTSSSPTGITIDNEGSVAGTNAPYIQLCVCQKD